MKRIGIIGTAGRKDDAARMTRDLYYLMYNRVLDTIHEHISDQRYKTVSGGAAWADHLAISLFLRDQAEDLTLHLPAEFEDGSYTETKSGRVANYYHKAFSDKMGANTLSAIEMAITKRANIQVHNGFFERNLYVGDVDILIALTWGTTGSECTDGHPGWAAAAIAGLKDGGTAHTWNHSKAPLKIHISLHDL